MQKKFFIALGIIIINLSLCACSNMYHPSTAPSKRDQCINLKRQQLFVGGDENAPAQSQTQWQIQSDRESIEREYQRMGCYELMHEEKNDKK